MSDHITEIIFQTASRMNTSHCTLHSMITVQEVILRFRSVQSKWMILQRLAGKPSGYEKKQEKERAEEMRFQEVSAFILMRRMSAE